MDCSQMTNSAGHGQLPCASSGGIEPTGIGRWMPTGNGVPVAVSNVLNSKSAQGDGRCAETGESHATWSPSPMGSDGGIARTSFFCVGRRQLGQTKERVMRTAFYVRVSTERQQQAQTIEQQVALLRMYVAEHPEWVIGEQHIFRDDGHSGAKLQRPGLDALRDQAARAAFDVVLVTAPDRLARNYVHQMVILEELERHGISVVFIDRPPSDDPHEQLVVQIRGAVAEYERTLIADRMRRGRLAKLRAGRLLPWTNAPYGYRVHPERPRDPALVEVDEATAAVVRELFQTYADGEATLHALAVRLTARGIASPTGRRFWSASTVRTMLNNPVYIGEAVSGRLQSRPSATRRSALEPVGRGVSVQLTPRVPTAWAGQLRPLPPELHRPCRSSRRDLPILCMPRQAPDRNFQSGAALRIKVDPHSATGYRGLGRPVPRGAAPGDRCARAKACSSWRLGPPGTASSSGQLALRACRAGPAAGAFAGGVFGRSLGFSHLRAQAKRAAAARGRSPRAPTRGGCSGPATGCC